MTGLQLKKARKKFRLTQSEAAQKLGVSQSYFSLLEKGNRPLTGRLAKKAVGLFSLSPTVIPLEADLKSLRPATSENLVRELAALGYPGYSHVEPSALKNPVQVMAAALLADNLEGRLVEALPWILLKFSNMEWGHLVDAAKRHDLQNRLGFLTALARKVAEKSGDSGTAAVMRRREKNLESSRLAKQDTLCRKMTDSERKWVRQTRSEEAARWNILSNLSADYLNYV